MILILMTILRILIYIKDEIDNKKNLNIKLKMTLNFENKNKIVLPFLSF